MYEGGQKAGPVDTQRQFSAVQRMQQESFDAAFAKARQEGKRTFEWQGNVYTTEMA